MVLLRSSISKVKLAQSIQLLKWAPYTQDGRFYTLDGTFYKLDGRFYVLDSRLYMLNDRFYTIFSKDENTPECTAHRTISGNSILHEAQICKYRTLLKFKVIGKKHMGAHILSAISRLALSFRCLHTL